MIKGEKNKRIIVGFLLISSLGKIDAQSLNEDYSLRTDTVFNSVVSVNLPLGYKQIKTFYDEGVFIDYYYTDGSILTLFAGALHKTPLLSLNPKYNIQAVDTIGARISYKGNVGRKNGEKMLLEICIYIMIMYLLRKNKYLIEYWKVLSSKRYN